MGRFSFFNDFYAFGFDALHDAVDAAGAKVVAAYFHHQALDADYG